MHPVDRHQLAVGNRKARDTRPCAAAVGAASAANTTPVGESRLKPLPQATADPPRQAGFTYLGALAAVALLSAVLGATAAVWHTAVTREKERELLFVGQQFRLAIERYHRATPGQVKRFPPTLEALLEDARLPGTQRYLRRLWRDPVTGQAEWGLVKGPDGAILGVHSLSEARPLKTAGFEPEEGRFEGAERYADWVFVYRPAQASARQRPPPGHAPALD